MVAHNRRLLQSHDESPKLGVRKLGIGRGSGGRGAGEAGEAGGAGEAGEAEEIIEE